MNPILEVELVDLWGIDFMGPFPSSFSHMYILLDVDYVKLLQYSGLGSNTGMGFHPTNDSHQCWKMVRLFVWIFGFG